jgi:hypothetical protein
MTHLRNFRDGLIAVALYFLLLAICEPVPAATKETTMNTPPAAPAPVRASVAIAWHHHDDRPTTPVKAIILIRPEGVPVALSELYDWDTVADHWISAGSYLKLRFKEFQWAAIEPVLAASVPRQLAAAPRLWPRSDEATADLLGLVGVKVTPEAVADWTDAQIEAAEDYAGAAHLQASDNDIEVPPLPDFLKGCEVQS